MKCYKVYIDSAAWMCEGNIVETSRIYRYILENGHEITAKPSEADFIIINSCGFIREREELSVSLFENYYSRRKENAKIIMFGCLVKIDNEKINSLDLIPIDFNEGVKFDEIFYTKIKFEGISPYCDEKTTEKLSVAKKTLQESEIISFSLSRVMSHFSKKVRLNYNNIIDRVKFKDKILVEICSGCIFKCSYCVIQKTKGVVRSRKIEDILSDIEKLYDPSKNLFLVADDCGSYGIDIKTNLFDLLYEIKKRYPDLKIELDAINPYWLEKYPDDYIKLFSEFNISYATIPVQSGSNRIIKDMNRNYDIKKIQNIVKRIKGVSPKTAIYTHFIICYPGEKFIDFLKTLYCSMYFDLPIVLVYSGHKGSTISDLFGFGSRFARAYRLNFFIWFLNFVVFYKLLTFQKENILK
ncbi:MAG: radical SAM protein [Euryarchaeota archaeon]|nr:radical SAM protein [Euryarchaeota archaeon]